jgi:hypothetical protein
LFYAPDDDDDDGAFTPCFCLHVPWAASGQDRMCRVVGLGVLKRRQARGASLQVAGRGADLATAAEKLSIIRTATFMVLPGQMRTKRHGPFTGDPDYFHSTFFTLGTVDEQ